MRCRDLFIISGQGAQPQSPLFWRQHLALPTLAWILLISCLSGCGGGNQGQGSRGGGNNQGPTLTAVTLSAVQTSLTVGGTSQLTAKGTYSDGSLQDLTTSVSYTLNPQAFGSVGSTGLYTAPSTAGSVAITATSRTITSNAITINVSVPPMLTLVRVDPTHTSLDYLNLVGGKRLRCQLRVGRYAHGCATWKCFPGLLPRPRSPHPKSGEWMVPRMGHLYRQSRE